MQNDRKDSRSEGNTGDIALRKLRGENPYECQTGRLDALELAATQFDHIDTADYETMCIRYLLKQPERPAGLNLLREIASVILIQPNGEVDIKLRNGQTLGRNDAS